MMMLRSRSMRCEPPLFPDEPGRIRPALVPNQPGRSFPPPRRHLRDPAGGAAFGAGATRVLDQPNGAVLAPLISPPRPVPGSANPFGGAGDRNENRGPSGYDERRGRKGSRSTHPRTARGDEARKGFDRVEANPE